MIPIILFAGKAGSGKDTACQELAKLLEGPLGVVAQADPMKRYIRDVFGLFEEVNLWGPTAAREEPRFADEVDYREFQKLTPSLCREIGISYDDSRDLFRNWYEDCSTRIVAHSVYPGLTVRHAAQQLGTEVVRQRNPDAWWQRAAHTAFELLSRRARYDRTYGIDRAAPTRHDAVAIPDGRFANEIIGIRQLGGLAVKLIGRASGQVGNAAHSSETSLDAIPDHFYDFVVDNSGTIDELREQLGQIVAWLSPCVTMSAETLRRRMG